MNSPPSFPPLCEAERGKAALIQLLAPPLCEAERGLGGEFKRKKNADPPLKSLCVSLNLYEISPYL